MNKYQERMSAYIIIPLFSKAVGEEKKSPKNLDLIWAVLCNGRS